MLMPAMCTNNSRAAECIQYLKQAYSFECLAKYVVVVSAMNFVYKIYFKHSIERDPISREIAAVNFTSLAHVLVQGRGIGCLLILY